MQFPYLHLSFDEHITLDQLPQIRGAIVDKIGRQHHLFHNHTPDGAKQHRYPLIQYKCLRDRPGLVCLGQGVDAVQEYLSRPDRHLHLHGGRHLPMKVARMNLRHCPLRAWNTWFSYRLENWLPLHGPHLAAYKQAPSLAQRLLLLERKLNSNIRTFTRSMGWAGDGQIEVRIHHIRKTGTLPLKDIPFYAFNIEFSTNVYLPQHIGLGKGAAFGYGVVSHKNHH